jgi:phenylpropionate dioxygenase-like ring-hydroxylating dioxygenase large terminal subunit
MTDPHDMTERIESRVNSGLHGQWYAVTKSVQVQPDRPHAVKALGRNLVLWRNDDGKLSCVEDYCPHRGAPLSRGEVKEGLIACRYHGVAVDGTGRIARVPAMPDCPLEGRTAVRSYAVTEAADAVFVYVPSAQAPNPPPLNLPEELTDPGWTGFLCVSPWASNYRYALDNLADPMHGCYLHAQSFTLAYGAKQDIMKLDKTESGFIVSRVNQSGENFDWTEMVFGASTYCRLDLPYPKAAGPGGMFRIIGYVLPVDENNCTVFFWRLRKCSGLERQSWRFLYRALLEERHWNVLEQDREMLSAMPDDARRREMLYQHDVGVSRIRLVLKQMARDQLMAEESSAMRSAS